MSWKSVLYEYVHARNQMELEYTIDPAHAYIIDDFYLDIQRERMKQLRLQHSERQLKPLRSTTGLHICHIVHQDEQIIADIALQKSLQYQMKQRIFQEERLEREYVTFQCKQGNWVIVEIVPDRAEQEGLSSLEKLSTSAANPDSRDLYSPSKQGYPSWNNYPPKQQDFFPKQDLPFRHARAKSTPLLNHTVFPTPEASLRKAGYNRAQAVQYADTWWNQANPHYIEFEVDCTNFISQCLYAGGAPMNYTGKRGSGWWYRGRQQNQELWSFSWAVSNSLTHHLDTSKSGLHAELVDSASQLSLGDVINYAWEGNSRYSHSTIVTAFDDNGEPLVNAHTTSSKHRLWDYRDSYAWTPQTQYRFMHISDIFS